MPEITLSRKAVPFRPQSKSSHFSPFPLGASLTSSAFRAQGLMEDDVGLQEVGRCLHLNSVRVLRLGLNKGAPAAGRRGSAPALRGDVGQQRLGRMTVRELSQRAGGLDYITVGAGVSGSARWQVPDPRLRGFVGRVPRELSAFEM